MNTPKSTGGPPDQLKFTGTFLLEHGTHFLRATYNFTRTIPTATIQIPNPKNDPKTQPNSKERVTHCVLAQRDLTDWYVNRVLSEHGNIMQDKNLIPIQFSKVLWHFNTAQQLT